MTDRVGSRWNDGTVTTPSTPTGKLAARSSEPSRRDFLTFCSAIAVTLGLGPGGARRVQAALASGLRPPVIWLHMSECTACTEAALRMTSPFFDDLILTKISLDYHETLMVAAGGAAEAIRDKAVADYAGEYFCVVEGAIPTADGGQWGRIGGRTMLSIAQQVCGSAKAIIALGACASNGGLPATAPNPSGAMGVRDALPGLSAPVISLPGCPPNPVNLASIFASYLLAGTLPTLDSVGRPTFAYGAVLCDTCEYKDTPRCLSPVGCQGPFTYHNCSKIKYNEGTSFCPQAQHVCIGCSQAGFWDGSPFWSRYDVAVDSNKAGKVVPATATLADNVVRPTDVAPSSDAGTTGRTVSSSDGGGCSTGGSSAARSAAVTSAVVGAFALHARRKERPPRSEQATAPAPTQTTAEQDAPEEQR